MHRYKGESDRKRQSEPGKVKEMQRERKEERNRKRERSLVSPYLTCSVSVANPPSRSAPQPVTIATSPSKLALGTGRQTGRMCASKLSGRSNWISAMSLSKLRGLYSSCAFTRNAPRCSTVASLSLRLCSRKRSVISSGGMPSTQCAAVSTYRSLISEPPQ